MIRTFTIAGAVVALHVAAAVAGEKATSARKPVQIFLLSGQSNMSGRGALGDLNKPAAEQAATLVRFIKAPENVAKYQSLYTGTNKTSSGWTIRDDVFIIMGEGTNAMHSGLRPNYGGFRNKGFGPELGIGHVLGERYEETILLVKASYGANSLGGNFRPPSSGGQLGDKYPLVVGALRDAIKRLPEIVPGYDPARGYQIAGFFWNQGEHDASDKLAPEYEENMANLIKDLRKDLNAPDMKAVVAITGYGGWDTSDKWKNVVRDAQLALPKRPEFAGTVATTETRDFYRPQEKFGGNNQTIHWHGNGESYWLMGEAMGRDMVRLLDSK
jgi:alpha-galactosidase